MPILCPIDFSDPSRGALRYAAVAASFAGESLTVLTVNDPLLEQAASMANGAGSLDADALRELRQFVNDTFSGRPAGMAVDFAVATGKPDAEILRVAVERKARLIVMSSRGATGIRKLFLGSVTERVLRATTVPVLVTPPADAGPTTPDDVKRTIRRILVPVDISIPGSVEQTVDAARQIGVILGAPILLVHVIEPVRTIVPGHAYAANVDSERRGDAELRLQKFVDAGPDEPRIEPLVVFGEPAEEVAKIAADRQAGLIVMGLHASAQPGTRMGSVTYRVLSIARELVLGVPPTRNP
jgi:nucleotide-binding universal stress UspA family protein